MKTRSKALLLSLCAVLLMAVSVFGTMAYFTSTETVVNTFTVGKVKIDLNETDVDKDGSTKANEYKLIPGQSYVKDPTVTVKADSEDAYVRMLVTVSNMDALKAAFEGDDSYIGTDGVFLLQKLVTGWDPAVWECKGLVGTDTYEFRYNTVVSKSETDTVLPALFTDVVIPGEIDNDHLAELQDIQIDVVAQAIQAIGFDDADEAWAAWK